MKADCEWEFEGDEPHAEVFASVYTTGFCGGDASAVCASCFLKELEPQANGYEWGGRRMVIDEDEAGYTCAVVLEGKWVTVPLEDAIQKAKELTGIAVMRWSELTEEEA